VWPGRLDGHVWRVCASPGRTPQNDGHGTLKKQDFSRQDEVTLDCVIQSVVLKKWCTLGDWLPNWMESRTATIHEILLFQIEDGEVASWNALHPSLIRAEKAPTKSLVFQCPGSRFSKLAQSTFF